MFKADHHLMRGTLDMLILKSLSAGSQHGYGVLEWIEIATESRLQILEGTIYPALHRLEKRGLIQSSWGTSEHNRRAKFYSLTESGRLQFEKETSMWLSYVSTMAKALEAPIGETA